jgi:hypothetical protein
LKFFFNQEALGTCLQNTSLETLVYIEQTIPNVIDNLKYGPGVRPVGWRLTFLSRDSQIIEVWRYVEIISVALQAWPPEGYAVTPRQFLVFLEVFLGLNWGQIAMFKGLKRRAICHRMENKKNITLPLIFRVLDFVMGPWGFRGPWAVKKIQNNPWCIKQNWKKLTSFNKIHKWDPEKVAPYPELRVGHISKLGLIFLQWSVENIP